MKKWLIILVLFLISLLAVVYGTKASDVGFFLPEPLSGVKIVIDPGHGGIDGGASSGETIERDITLSMSLKLEKKLKSQGATVIMTRSKEGDSIAEHRPDEDFPTTRARKVADLLLREEIMNNSEADLIISMHVNAVPEERWRGAQVFYHADGHEGGQLLAKSIQGSIRKNIGNTEREALSIKQVYILKKANAPAVLVETGFLSNNEERELLKSEKYQKQMVEAISKGIAQYVEENIY
ncbi:N-acetylmuramoyl-L-alanine amidase [Psychrobacillus antarcticus]|uniref:N-acetylmuramoyl-L-alanine amidase n=1 Tax=Psychrobacillus antarcticus TaxID=2879115 RepID=UPI002407F82C|nr:N-acetylmuramoyl-L-alanine amidase [Psychrobacillus antarcticus]